MREKTIPMTTGATVDEAHAAAQVAADLDATHAAIHAQSAAHSAASQAHAAAHPAQSLRPVLPQHGLARSSMPLRPF